MYNLGEGGRERGKGKGRREREEQGREKKVVGGEGKGIVLSSRQVRCLLPVM